MILKTIYLFHSKLTNLWYKRKKRFIFSTIITNIYKINLAYLIIIQIIGLFDIIILFNNIKNNLIAVFVFFAFFFLLFTYSRQYTITQVTSEKDIIFFSLKLQKIFCRFFIFNRSPCYFTDRQKYAYS